jgi:tetratricopeptide (TPR) repeat protein
MVSASPKSIFPYPSNEPDVSTLSTPDLLLLYTRSRDTAQKLFAKKRFADAGSYFQLTLQCTTDVLAQAECALLLAECYDKTGYLHEAVELRTRWIVRLQALQHEDRHAMLHLLVRAHGFLGITYNKMLKYSEALHEFKQAETYATTMDDWQLLCHALRHQCYATFLSGKHNETIAVCARLLLIAMAYKEKGREQQGQQRALISVNFFDLPSHSPHSVCPSASLHSCVRVIVC